MRTVRWLPALALLALLAALPVDAWYRALRPDVIVWTAASGIDDVTWRATIAPDGAVAVEITYAIDPGPTEAAIRVPRGGRDLRVDGRPVAADVGRFVDVTVDGPYTVAYVLPDAVTRYRDGALLRIGGITEQGGIDGDEALLWCVPCYTESVGFGDVALLGGLAAGDLGDPEALRVAFGGLGQARGEVDPASASTPSMLRFVGVVEGAAPVTLLVQLPESAVPDLAPVEGSVDDAFGAARADIAATGTRQAGLSNDPPLSEQGAAIGLAVLFVATMAWMLWRLVGAWRGQRADLDAVRAAPPPDAPHEPPSALEPALAGIMVGGIARNDRCPVAGTILAMARDGLIDIDGIDSQQFTLKLPPGVHGRTPTEEAVLTELRPQGNPNAAATLTGPPLWGDDRKAAYRRIMRAAITSARKARLIRLTLSALVLVPLALTMGIIALIGSGGDSILAWVVTFVGPVLAIATSIFTGFSRTRAGRAEHDRWTDYARWLRTNLELRDVGAPGIAIWDPVLPEAAAIGAAPTASRALSPEV